MKLNLGKNKNLLIALAVAGVSFVVISRMMNKDTVASPKTITHGKADIYGSGLLPIGNMPPARNYDPNYPFPNPDVANDDIISTQNWGPPTSASYMMQPGQVRPQVMNAYNASYF